MNIQEESKVEFLLLQQTYGTLDNCALLIKDCYITISKVLASL